MRPTLHQILDHVSLTYGVPADRLRTRYRGQREDSIIRHIFCWYAVEKSGENKPAIGRFLSRDHSTVYYGWKKVADMIARGEMERPVQLPASSFPVRSIEEVPEPEPEPAPRPKRSTPKADTGVRRRYRVVPYVARPAPLPANVTALLMGDPPIERSALALEAAE